MLTAGEEFSTLGAEAQQMADDLEPYRGPTFDAGLALRGLMEKHQLSAIHFTDTRWRPTPREPDRTVQFSIEEVTLRVSWMGVTRNVGLPVLLHDGEVAQDVQALVRHGTVVGVHRPVYPEYPHLMKPIAMEWPLRDPTLRLLAAHIVDARAEFRQWAKEQQALLDAVGTEGSPANLLFLE